MSESVKSQSPGAGRLELADVRRAVAVLAEERTARKVRSDGTPVREAAVALLLRHADAPEALFIRRAEHPDDPWSGHMALPGGHRDPEDLTLVSTAERETLEEIGVDLDAHAERLGPLPALPAIARSRTTDLFITPYVYFLDEAPGLSINHEVAEALWWPMSAIVQGSCDSHIAYHHDGHTLRFPAWDLDGRKVWGLTYQMLLSLFCPLGYCPPRGLVDVRYNTERG